MDIFEAINKRTSYRWKYEKTPVPHEDLVKIVEAGLAAPTGCNLQTTHIVGVDDPAVIAKLGKFLESGYFNTAPAAIVVLTRPEVAFAGTSYHVQDYSAAIQNMLLAITALGYASCWVEGYVAGFEDVSKGMAEILGAPEEYSVVAYLPVGVPSGAPRRAPKKSIEERAGFNSFSGGME